MSVHRGGVPQYQVLSQVTGPRSFPGGTPVPDYFPGHWSQVLSWGCPGQDGGTLGWDTPSQVRLGDPPGQVRLGYPLARLGCGIDQVESGWGTSWAGQFGVCTLGQVRMGVPQDGEPSPGQDGCTPKQVRLGYPPPQNSRANTCYVI